jgi:hypothetical protein
MYRFGKEVFIVKHREHFISSEMCRVDVRSVTEIIDGFAEIV